MKKCNAHVFVNLSYPREHLVVGGKGHLVVSGRWKKQDLANFSVMIRSGKDEFSPAKTLSLCDDNNHWAVEFQGLPLRKPLQLIVTARAKPAAKKHDRCITVHFECIC